MIFWSVIAGLTAGVVAIMALTLLRGRADNISPAAYDLQVYRDQLKEVERDLARGVIGPEDAERVRTEVSRRVLAADTALQKATSQGEARSGGNIVISAVMAVLVGGGAIALYSQLGTPGYGDLPIEARIAASDEARTTRLSQADAEARAPAQPQADAAPEFLELMDKLRQTVKDRPDDLRGLDLLVRNEAGLGNVRAAHLAQARVIEIKGPKATADDYALQADLMIAAAHGYVSAEAEKVLRAALQRNPEHQTTRYYLGLYLLQVDRPDGAFRTWERLLRDSAADAPWVQPIREQLEEIAWRAGVEYTLPEARQPRGPSAEDVEAAQDMSAADRSEMIRGMVTRLSDRLSNEGGPPEDWARLIGALAVLGEADRAHAVWTEARQVFAQNPDAMALLRTSAERAGLVE